MQKGTYMKVSDVLNYLDTKIFKFTLKSIVEKTIKQHTHESCDCSLYLTTDLQNVIAPVLYRQMETQIITLFFNPKFN